MGEPSVSSLGGAWSPYLIAGTVYPTRVVVEGSGTTLIQNLSTTTVVTLSDRPDSEGSPLGPQAFIVVDGCNDVYASCPASTNAIVNCCAGGLNASLPASLASPSVMYSPNNPWLHGLPAWSCAAGTETFIRPDPSVQSSNNGWACVNTLSYDMSLQVQDSGVAATIPWAIVILRWYDLDTTAYPPVAVEQWVVPILHNDANLGPIYGQGPTRGSFCKLSIYNEDSNPVNVIVSMTGTARTAPRPDLRWTDGNISGGSYIRPTTVPGSNGLGTVQLNGGLGGTYLMGMYSGKVGLSYSTTGGANSNVTALLNGPTWGPGSTAIPFWASGQIPANTTGYVEFTMPRTPLQLNLNSAAGGVLTISLVLLE